jgi:hypothetical protein
MILMIMFFRICIYIGLSVGGLWLCFGMVKYGQNLKQQKLNDYYDSIDRTRDN